MKTTRLKSPKPLKNHKKYQEFKYPIIGRLYLDIPEVNEQVDFFRVVAGRKTRREFKDLPLSYLSSILWYSAHNKRSRIENRQVTWHHRPVASAGGCHPLDVLILRPYEQGWEPFVYDPHAHCLCSLSISAELIESFIMQVESVIPIQQGTIFWFIAQIERTLSRYLYGDSLIWRDAGVMIGHVTLVAEALGLSCCPVGITGDSEIDLILPSNGKLAGMGGCLFGTRCC